MAGVVELVTAPEYEPVTASEVRLHTHISHTDEDATLNKWITSARVLAEGYQRRACITQTRRLSFDSWPRFPVRLPYAPLQSLTSLLYYDTDSTEYTFALTDLDVDTASTPGRVALGYNVNLPTTILRSINAVRFLYVCGEAAASGPVVDAIMLYCAWRYENRTAEAGAAPQAFWDLLYPDSRFI